MKKHSKLIHGLVSLLILLTGGFALLKYLKIISWNWLMVFTPLLFPIVMVLFVFVVWGAMVLIEAGEEIKNSDKDEEG